MTVDGTMVCPQAEFWSTLGEANGAFKVQHDVGQMGYVNLKGL